MSDDRRCEALGVGRQLTTNTAIAHGLAATEIHEYVDNDRSASNGRVREEYQRLLADIPAMARPGDVLVGYNQDRLVRDTIELEQLIALCRRHGVAVHTHSGEVNVATADGRTHARLLGVIARGETEKLGERVRAALEQNARRGAPHGRVPYGWQRVVEHDPRTGARLSARDVVDPEQAAVVSEIADRIIGGDSLRGIVADLNRRGIPSPTGKPWGKQMLRHVVLRERNVGDRVHNGVVVGPGAWPAILPRGVAEQVRAILRDPQRKTSSSSAATHLLSGIARCGVCGGVIRASLNRTVPSYRCAERGCVSRARRDVDSLVTGVVVAFLARQDAALLSAPHRDDIRRAAEEAAQLRARLDTAADDYADGRIDARQLERITSRVRPRLEAAEARSRVVDDSPLLSGLIGNPGAAEVWAALPLTRRRAVVDLLADIHIDRAHRGAREFDPDAVRFDWRQP